MNLNARCSLPRPASHVLGAVILLTLATPAGAATIAVPGTVPTIGQALAQAQPGDIVLVSCGTYYEHDLRVPSGVSLWSGTLQSRCATIDAGGQGRALICDGTDSTTAIVGFTLIGGRVQGPGDAGRGGAILCRDSAAKIANCVLQSNAADEGGAIAALGRQGPHIEHCTFTTNTATTSGGAIAWRVAGRGDVRTCEISGNSALVGGGLYASACQGLRLANVSLVENAAANVGGGVYLGDADVRIEDCLLAGNLGGVGGSALALQRANASVVGCTFSANAAPSDSGSVILCLDAGPTLQNCLLAFNQARAVDGNGPPWPAFIGSDLFANGDGNWDGPVATQQNEAGNFALDPLFCNAYGGDYQLRASSPCLPGRPPHRADRPVGAFAVGCADR